MSISPKLSVSVMPSKALLLSTCSHKVRSWSLGQSQHCAASSPLEGRGSSLRCSHFGRSRSIPAISQQQHRKVKEHSTRRIGWWVLCLTANQVLESLQPPLIRQRAVTPAQQTKHTKDMFWLRTLSHPLRHCYRSLQHRSH